MHNLCIVCICVLIVDTIFIFYESMKLDSNNIGEILLLLCLRHWISLIYLLCLHHQACLRLSTHLYPSSKSFSGCASLLFYLIRTKIGNNRRMTNDHFVHENQGGLIGQGMEMCLGEWRITSMLLPMAHGCDFDWASPYESGKPE